MGASASAIPHSLYKEIIHDIAPTEIEQIDVTIKLANRDTISPIGIVNDVEVLWGTKNKKSAGYLVFPHKTSTSLTIPIGEIVYLLASLIVTSITSISAGEISCIIYLYKEIGISLALAPISHKP